MSPEAQRIAIARECGWTLHQYGDGGCLSGWRSPTGHGYRDSIWRTYYNDDELPDYLNDLNALAEVEKLIENRNQKSEYVVALKGVIPGDGRGYVTEYMLATATPAQRAAACVKTLGLWEDSK